MLAVDAGADADHRCRVALQYGHVVQCAGAALEWLAVAGHLYECAALHMVVVGIEHVDGQGEVVGTEVGQASQPPHVHAQYGRLAGPHHASRAQQRAVAAHGDGEVGMKLASAEGLYGVSGRQQPCRAQEVVVGRLHEYARPVLLQAAEHLAHRRRLLVLVYIAKEGKGEFLLHA